MKRIASSHGQLTHPLPIQRIDDEQHLALLDKNGLVLLLVILKRELLACFNKQGFADIALGEPTRAPTPKVSQLASVPSCSASSSSISPR